jgi:hypothetical protein
MAPPTKKPARAPKEYVANLPVGEGAIHLNSYWGVDFGDQSLWATSLVSAKRRKGKSAPGAVDLENAITGIQITDTIAGFSTIVVKFEDSARTCGGERPRSASTPTGRARPSP